MDDFIPSKSNIVGDYKKQKYLGVTQVLLIFGFFLATSEMWSAWLKWEKISDS